jgi:hypothetical protein
VALPVVQPASVPDAPLHLLIDSTGLQVYGAGQWPEAKHGAKWRKLHLAVDAGTGMTVAQILTDQDTMIRRKMRRTSEAGHWPGSIARDHPRSTVSNTRQSAVAAANRTASPAAGNRTVPSLADWTTQDVPARVRTCVSVWLPR